MKSFIVTTSRRVLLWIFSIVFAVVTITGSVSFFSASAIIKVPVCDFTQDGNGLRDFELGKCVCDYAFYLNAGIGMYSPCPEECSPYELQPSQLTGKNNRDKMFNYFIDQGLVSQQASGIVGNIEGETNGTYSPTYNQAGKTFPDGGYGIGQWSGDARTYAIEHINQKNADILPTYYVSDFSKAGAYTGEDKGFIPKNASSGVSMTDIHNDSLLLSQLEYIILQSTNRTISPATAEKVEGLTVGENEWQAIKKQTSFEGVSNIWVYNYKVPENIDTVAADRIARSEAVYQKYGDVEPDTNACNNGLVGSTRQKVVAVAEAEYAKWESGELKAGTDFQKYLEGNGDTEWCAYFASWVYKEAGYTVTADGRPYSGVSQFEAATDRFTIHPADGSYTPQPGDLASYGYHINIVVAVSADNPREFTTIGGNEGPVTVTIYDRKVKKTAGTYWSGEAEYYISPKG